MTILVNSFNGGSNGVTITTGNSGGASGNAFDLTGGSPAFSNTHAAHGSLSCSAMSSGGETYVAWSTSLGTQPQVWFRQYLYLTGNPGAFSNVVQFLDTSVTSCAGLGVNTNGTFAFADHNGTTQIISAESAPLNSWFRIEGYVVSSATVGQLALNIYNSKDSAVATETHVTAADINTFGTLNQVRFGIASDVTYSFWLDDIGVSSTAYLGPVSQVRSRTSLPSLIATM